jgi:hypothetical protein
MTEAEAKVNKTCTACGTTQAVEMFPLQKSHNGKRYPASICKPCRTAKSVEWARKNPQKRKQIWQQHAENNREAYQEANRKYYAAHREERIEAQRKARAADRRIKTNARALLAHYVKIGAIQRKPCERCRSTVRIHGHHHDYAQPLDVTWLCSECHGKEHRG